MLGRSRAFGSDERAQVADLPKLACAVHDLGFSLCCKNPPAASAIWPSAAVIPVAHSSLHDLEWETQCEDHQAPESLCCGRVGIDYNPNPVDSLS
jgi:hypothetical protein